MTLTGPAALRAVRRLDELEAVIERGLTTFVDVGEALTEIRDSRLYRETYTTWEAYCQGRWGWSASRGHDLIRAAAIVALVSGDTKPADERQARALRPLIDQPEVLRDVWAGVIERAERDETPITGPVIRNAVRDRIRGEAAASEAELQEATAAWSDEQRDAVRPEVMRQRGQLMRLIHDINGLPDAATVARGGSVTTREITGPADLRDQKWLDEQVALLGDGIEAAFAIWSNWTEGRGVGRLHPGQSAGEYIASLGLRLTLAEAMAALPDGSLRQVAAVAGVSHETVRAVKNLTPEPEARVIGADGKSYPGARRGDDLPLTDAHAAKFPALAAADLRVQLTQALYAFGKPGSFVEALYAISNVVYRQIAGRLSSDRSKVQP